PHVEETLMALVWRLHHCLADGTTGMRLGSKLLWSAEPDGVEPLASAWAARATPGRRVLFARGVAARARGRAHLRLPGHAATHEGAGTPLARRAIARELARSARATPLAGRVGPARAVAFAELPLDEMRVAGKTLADTVTLNDVVLGIIAGGVRVWLGR